MGHPPITLAASALGAPAAPRADMCATQAIAILTAAAGEGMRLTSISLDVTSHPLAAEVVTVTTSIDKRARSLVFASCEARADEQLVFSAQALFARET